MSIAGCKQRSVQLRHTGAVVYRHDTGVLTMSEPILSKNP